MTELDDLCAKGLSYAQNWAFVVASATKSLIALAGCVGFVFVYYHQRLTSIFHSNARVILKFHIGFVLCGSASIFVGSGYDVLRFTVFRWINRSPSCAIPPISPYFMLVHLPMLVGLEGSTFTATAWALERIYATVFIGSSYEKFNSGLGWIMCALSLLLTLAFALIRALLGDYSKPVPLVMITGSSYRFTMIIINVCASLELFNVLVFLVLYCVNLRRFRKVALINSSLTYKYQLRENLQATLLIFPLNLLHCIAYFPVAVLIPVLTKHQLVQTERVLLYTFVDWIPLYFVALPMLLWWRNGVKRNSIQRLVENNLIGEKYALARKEGKVETAKYFEVFNQMWTK